MNSDTETVKEKPERVLYGKVAGVLQHPYQLKALVETLAKLGVREVEVLKGASGTIQLEKWKETVSQYFFGDMESDMLQGYCDAVAEGDIVFAAVVVSEQADKTAEIARMQGATDIVHFGNSAVTNY
jgi:precorrin-6B methylase 2